MSAAHCPYGDESFVVADYLAGRLSEADASAFEEHSFACDRCFDELQRATELKAAEPAPAPPRRTRAISWQPLALAAAVVLGVGIWLARPVIDAPPGPVYRDGGDAAATVLPLTVARGGERVTLSWEPLEDADVYEVRVFDEAGNPVFEKQTAAPALEISAAEWRSDAGTGPFYAQVIALDELRQTIARSDFEPL